MGSNWRSVRWNFKSYCRNVYDLLQLEHYISYVTMNIHLFCIFYILFIILQTQQEVSIINTSDNFILPFIFVIFSQRLTYLWFSSSLQIERKKCEHSKCNSENNKKDEIQYEGILETNSLLYLTFSNLISYWVNVLHFENSFSTGNAGLAGQGTIITAIFCE